MRSAAVDDYRNHGAALLHELYPMEVVSAIAYQLSEQLRAHGVHFLRKGVLGTKASYDVPGTSLPFLLTFLWGLTPTIQELVGARLLPTYSYFRTYQRGDVCRVHSDRHACEHSLSLTLAYSDGIEWPLSVARSPLPEGETLPIHDDFGGDASIAFPMSPGDGVLYRGVAHRHGRVVPNPNRWSAHLFMHWIDRDGPYRQQAFDGKNVIGHCDFRFPDQAPA